MIRTLATSEVRIPAGNVVLDATIAIPERARGVVLFAHGSGSGRFSSRNMYVASELEKAGLATVLLDLLTDTEELEDQLTGHLRFDLPMLARRLVAVTDWLGQQPQTRDLPLAYFGASTGAGAALIAAATRPRVVRAVVSRGGRPDLAGEALTRVIAPTLLIVGGLDREVVALNEGAMAHMREAEVTLRIVAGAGHLFEEPGALAQVARLAAEWFTAKLRPPTPAVAGALPAK